MGVEELTGRERQVFLSIVRSFIETAEPVGSRHLAKHYHLSCSPATVRNVMADLEEKGLIYQPHKSAGRIPTDVGYRQYVDSLMGSASLTKDEKSQIIDELARFSKDVNMVVDTASHVLSSISSQLGVILAPKFIRGKIAKIELISLSEDNLLVVFKIELGLVKTVIVEINRKVPARLLETMKEILNERLHGLSIAEIQQFIDERFNDVDSETKILLNLIKEETDKKLNLNSTGDIKFSGAKNFLFQPEFETREKVGKILELLDRQDILIRLLNGADAEGVSIIIGEENEETLMKNCSLITTTYRLRGAQGTLGVIGPTRMQYAKIVALVQFMSEMLGYLMSKPDIDMDQVISDL